MAVSQQPGPPGGAPGGWGPRGSAPNIAYAGNRVAFPDPVRAARYPDGVWVDAAGHPVLTPYARAAAEVDAPPPGFGVDELRVTDVVAANVALARTGHELWRDLPLGATPHGWTWHHVAGSRRLELVPVDVKVLLRHHAGLATSTADHGRRGTRPLQSRRPVHFELPADGQAVGEEAVRELEEDLGIRLPGPYRTFLKAAGGRAPVGLALDPELGVLVDQPFWTVRGSQAADDLAYANRCLREYLTRDYLAVGYVQGGLIAVRLRGTGAGSVWFCAYDDARDHDGTTVEQRCAELLLPCGEDFDAFLRRLAGNPPELVTVATAMVDGGFARAVELSPPAPSGGGFGAAGDAVGR
ncbi:SMI1/KNR4 family protein [Allostreptomyces psammosilenae]|uniref:Knr4/Smi1-like domain-containing protein n=1 Tax=Allostreptomyces psammosilenae TaxID=1892865 RepID=A0A852ZVM6_9ACTN|nr:SMI1/KNR4 family protein [Allostreptomyces psammosilenae]NYI05995.1 hypothetical protein [Allostreptomyces psammosilenae]